MTGMAIYELAQSLPPSEQRELIAKEALSVAARGIKRAQKKSDSFTEPVERNSIKVATKTKGTRKRTAHRKSAG